MMDSRPLLVTIQCCTYNQERYIRQCLDGFVMQQTNFRFEAVVHDDASTDGTAAIIREYADKYPDIIKAILERENQFSKKDGSLGRIMYEHTHGKYVALCEGDDYWIDPLKLQKQVDYMEAHPECSFIHTRFSYKDENKGIVTSDSSNDTEINRILSEEKDRIGYYILKDNKYRIQTMSVLYRKESFDKIWNTLAKEQTLFLMGDTQLWLNLLRVGEVKYLPDVTAVYRLSPASASRAADPVARFRFSLSCEEMRLYYSRVLNIQDPLFYKNYIKALFKYLIYQPRYRTDERIIEFKNIDPLSRLVIKLRLMSAFKWVSGFIG